MSTSILYSNKLLLCMENNEICTDDFGYSYEDNNICSLCGGKYSKSYITFIYDENVKTKSCFLCNVVCNFKCYSTGKCFLITSELKQNEINVAILQHFNTKNEIPKPTEIDPNCKIVKLSLFEFVKCYQQMTCSQQKLFADFKIMFTGEVMQNLQSGASAYFGTNENKHKKIKYDLSCFEMEEHSFSSKQKEVLESVKTNINIKEKESINKIAKSLSDKEICSISVNQFIKTIC